MSDSHRSLSWWKALKAKWNSSPLTNLSSLDFSSETTLSVQPVRSASSQSQTCERIPSEASPASILIPEGFTPQYKYPLLVWLAADKAEQQRAMTLMTAISDRNSLGVSLEYPDDWLLTDSQHQWDASLTQLMKTLPVAPQRIFLIAQGFLGEQIYAHALASSLSIAGVISLRCDDPRQASQTNLNTQAVENSRSPRLFWAPPKQVAPHQSICHLDAWITATTDLSVQSPIWREIDRFVLSQIPSAIN